MNAPTLGQSLRGTRLLPLALLVLLLGGCLEQVYVWSPDGQRLALVNPAKAELRLCDASGRLLPASVPDVFRVAWFSDSQRLVLARMHDEKNWAPLARAMGATRANALVARADAAWQRLQAGERWSGIGGIAELFADRDADWKFMCIHLRDRYGEQFRSKLDAGQWDDVMSKSVEIHELVMARIDGDRIVIGTQLYAGIDELVELRVAPGDKVVAFVAEFQQGKAADYRLWVVPVDASTPELIAERVAAQPDWTPDGRALIYFQAAGTSSDDDLQLGTLVRREVLDAAGRIEIASDQTYLAGGIFSEQSRVRCLRDGRILFNAAEITLPIATEDYGEQREQLFALDPARQATLVRMIPRKQQNDLPKGLAFFEVSPDEQRVLFGDLSGAVCVLTLASGAVDYVQQPSKDGLQGAPGWRHDGTFTYTRRAAAKGGENPSRAAEVVLRDGKQETVLSAGWPDEIVNALVSDRN